MNTGAIVCTRERLSASVTNTPLEALAPANGGIIGVAGDVIEVRVIAVLPGQLGNLWTG